MLKQLIDSKFRKDLFYSYFAQIISIGFGFIHIILINKYFGVDLFGQLAIIISSIGIFSALLTTRSNEAVTRFFAREMQNKNLEGAKFVFFIGLFFDLITALLLIVVIYFISNFISSTFIKDASLNFEVFLYSIVAFFIFLKGSFTGYLQSKEMFKVINNNMILEAFFKIFTLILIIQFFDNSLFNIIISLILSSFLSFLFISISSIKYFLSEFKSIGLSFSKDLLKEYWSFNLKTFTSSSLKAGAANIDNIILGYYLDAQSVGIYQTIKKLLSPLSFLIAPFGALTIKKIVVLFESENYKEIHHLVKNITIKLLGVSFLIGFILYFVLEPYLLYQNIQYQSYMIAVFLILLIFYLLPTFVWWARNFIIMYNPMIPIYSNLLLTINSIWIPIVLFNLGYFEEGLITISVGILLATIPSWLFAPIIYLSFMRNKKVI